MHYLKMNFVKVEGYDRQRVTAELLEESGFGERYVGMKCGLA
jgi:hypothetical protein